MEFDLSARPTIFDYVGLKNYVATLFDGPLDVVDRDALKPHLRRFSVQDGSMPSDVERAVLHDILLTFLRRDLRGRLPDLLEPLRSHFGDGADLRAA